jgi:hypothetical protein
LKKITKSRNFANENKKEIKGNNNHNHNHKENRKEEPWLKQVLDSRSSYKCGVYDGNL